MHFLKIISRQLFGCLIFFCAACKQTHNDYHELRPRAVDTIANQKKNRFFYKQIFIAGLTLHKGDIVTRTGNDFTSQSLRLLNRRDQAWSHCGIVNIENDSAFVYHALGGEWNPRQALIREPFYRFADPDFNTAVGIFRTSFSDSQLQKIIDFSKHCYEQQLPFDMNFDLGTDDRMYCSEFAYKAFQHCGETDNIKPNHIQGFYFIGVDDIILQPGIVCIGRLEYHRSPKPN